MSNQSSYRPRSNLLFAGIGIALCGLFIWSSFYQGGTTNEITSFFVALFVLICIYIFLIRPKVLFCDEGVVITNPLMEFSIGWADVIAMDTRWAFSIQTKEFTVSAWAATVSGRHSRSIHHTQIKGLDIDQGGSMRTADSPNSDSGAVAYRSRVYLKRFQEARTQHSLPTSRVREIRPLLLALVSLGVAIATNFVGH